MEESDLQSWSVDSNEYRRVYFETISRLVHLPQDLVAKISTPEAFSAPASYFQTAPRILVFGQETYGNYQAALSCHPFNAWATQVGGQIAFDYAYGGDSRQRAGRFWIAFQSIADSFGLPSRRSLGWTNLLKVQLLEPIAGSMSISQLPVHERSTLVKWQRDLFRAELSFAKPDAILFLTGGLHWVAEHMFDDYSEEKRNGFSVITASAMSSPMVKTYHPGARVQGVAAGLEAAIAYLKKELSRRKLC